MLCSHRLHSAPKVFCQQPGPAKTLPHIKGETSAGSLSRALDKKNLFASVPHPRVPTTSSSLPQEEKQQQNALGFRIIIIQTAKR